MDDNQIIEEIESIIQKKFEHRDVRNNFYFISRNSLYFNESNELIGMNINSQQFKEFPKNFFNLKYLQHLKLRSTIKEIPSSINKLPLETLDLMDSEINSIPDSIYSIKTLKKLIINLKKFKKFPNKVFDNNNSITSLTLNMKDLEDISKFESTIKNTYQNQDKITDLTIYGNAEIIKKILSKFHNLEQLCIVTESEFFKEMEFNQFQNLKIFIFHDKTKSIPESISKLENLEELWLNNNSIEQLPESFGTLEKLGFLHLGDNQLKRLPITFGNLCSLTELHLDNNQLEELPASFGNLTELKYLELKNNKLNSIPDSIKNLKELVKIDLYGNNLKTIPKQLSPKSFPNLYRIEIEEEFFHLFRKFLGTPILKDSLISI